jgi:hypothetical protein
MGRSRHIWTRRRHMWLIVGIVVVGDFVRGKPQLRRIKANRWIKLMMGKVVELVIGHEKEV